MVSSSPPPSGVPCTAAMVGFLMSSISEITSIRPGGCERLAELGDVGAGDERAARAGHHDRFHARVVARLLEAFHQARAHAMAQRIHGRIVDGDDGDVAVATHADWIVHERLLPEIFFIYSKLPICALTFTQIQIPQCGMTFCTLTPTLGCGGLACQMRTPRCATRLHGAWERDALTLEVGHESWDVAPAHGARAAVTWRPQIRHRIGART